MCAPAPQVSGLMGSGVGAAPSGIQARFHAVNNTRYICASMCVGRPLIIVQNGGPSISCAADKYNYFDIRNRWPTYDLARPTVSLFASAGLARIAFVKMLNGAEKEWTARFCSFCPLLLLTPSG